MIKFSLNHGAVTIDVAGDTPLLWVIRDHFKFKGSKVGCGTPRPRLDGLAKATGTAVFGIDIDIPGLYYAALVRCPVHGGAVMLENGVVQQSNFHDYPVLRMVDAPDIGVLIVDADNPPTGVGEPGLPPVAAAIGNAVFAASAQRLRQLPLRLG